MHNLSLLILLSLSILAGCASKGKPLETHIKQAYDTTSGQPIPAFLPAPETWQYLGLENIPNQYQRMKWLKPDNVAPRPVKIPQTADDINAAQAMLHYPMINFTGKWTESFEYLALPSAPIQPAAYGENYQKFFLEACPSGAITTQFISDNELILEVKTKDCPKMPDHDEIDRFVFGKGAIYQFIYNFNTTTLMTNEQRDAAIKAVSGWGKY